MQIKGKTEKWGIQRGGEALQSLFLEIRVYCFFKALLSLTKPF